MADYLERYSSNWSDDSVRLIHTPAPAIKQTFFYIQETGYFKTTPPYFTERENLDSYLVVVTLSGNGRLVYRDCEYTLTAGDVFWIHCRSHHYYECQPGGEWEFLWFHFHGAGSHGFYQEFIKTSPPVCIGAGSAEMISDIQAIIALTETKSFASDVRIAHRIHSVLTQLILAAPQKDRASAAVPEVIEAVTRELEQHYQETITLDDLAHKYGISKFYLARQFKTYTGSPIGEYVIRLRINHAKELLKYSDYTVNAIASSCGIANVSHFIRIFKSREGRTPLQFRNEWS